MMSEAVIRELATLAELPLGDDRLAALADLYGTWLTAANALNARLERAEHHDLMPITTFTHAHVGSDE